jgi:hypothetical protein
MAVVDHSHPAAGPAECQRGLQSSDATADHHHVHILQRREQLIHRPHLVYVNTSQSRLEQSTNRVSIDPGVVHVGE